MHQHNLWHLPEAPGTVIAIGKWWLVRLEPHNGTGPGCWALLPARDEETSRSMKRAGVKDQCVYGDDWVLAEAEQEGGYLVVATAERTWYGPTMRNVFPKEQQRAQAHDYQPQHEAFVQAAADANPQATIIEPRTQEVVTASVGSANG